MKAAIVLENWKIEVFGKGLKDAGYSFENKGKFPGSPDMTILHVEFTDHEHIKSVLEKCSEKCRILRHG